MDVKAGEFIGIVGPSGSGKSTLLSIAGALLSPSKGDIYIREQNITKLSEKEMTDIRLKKIGFIFQFANLVPYLNVKEQLLYIAKLKKESKQESEKRADHLLAAFGLGERKKSLSKSTIWWGKTKGRNCSCVHEQPRFNISG